MLWLVNVGALSEPSAEILNRLPPDPQGSTSCASVVREFSRFCDCCAILLQILKMFILLLLTYLGKNVIKMHNIFWSGGPQCQESETECVRRNPESL
jgi:hypothetical protein